MLPAGAGPVRPIRWGTVADQDPEAARLEREAEAARAEYQRNREAVAAAADKSNRSTPLRVATIVVAVIAAGLFVATVVSYYNNPQQTGPTNTDLPTAVAIAALALVWLAVGPFILERRTVGKRVRNIIIGVVVTAILIPLTVPLFVELGSLVGDLAYNLSH